MKLYDFDGMFDKKLSEYIAANPSRYTEEEWEDVIPKLYRKFGDAVIPPLGCSPRAYYAGLDDETLVKTLRAHLKQGVPVSDFLCSAIEARKAVSLLMPLLDGSEAEREYAVNLIGADDSAIKKYMAMLVGTDDEDMKNRLVDNIKQKADLVSDEAIENYKNGVEREYMLEILSRSVVKNDKIYNILINEFLTGDDIPMHASFLAAYGDERALGALLEKIDEEDITFVEFQELKFAIESLGGEYTKPRDFSGDEYYELIKNVSAQQVDLFDKLNKK